MRVRYLGHRDATGARTGDTSLTVGSEYVVLAVVVAEGAYHKLMLLDDRTSRPTLYSASHFDLVSDDVPSTWRVRIGGSTGSAGYLMIAPGPWLEPGFFEEFWGDGGVAALAAQSIFEEELQVILNESR